MKIYIITICCCLAGGVGFAQTQILGHRLINTAIVLDPNEIQMCGSITGNLDNQPEKNQYIPFTFGASQSIFSKTVKDDVAWEIYVELGAFTQFEWVFNESVQQRNLLNTDYRIAFSYARRMGKSTYRIRFFHLSTHLGDDYLIRNSVNTYTPNSRNYEQLDFTFYQFIQPLWKVYLGAGSVVRPNSIRLPFSYQFGTQKEFKNPEGKWGYSFGINMKGHQETDFNPNVKTAVGLAYFVESKQEPLRLLLEYYRGHLPYSQFEQSKIEWIGIGLYFYI